jgi:hypothetical protein
MRRQNRKFPFWNGPTYGHQNEAQKSVHRMENVRHRIKRYKTRKTNEIWLLGAKSKSGTLDSADVLWEAIRTGPLHGLTRV